MSLAGAATTDPQAISGGGVSPSAVLPPTSADANAASTQVALVATTGNAAHDGIGGPQGDDKDLPAEFVPTGVVVETVANFLIRVASIDGLKLFFCIKKCVSF